jgi:hypothetical protein
MKFEHLALVHAQRSLGDLYPVLPKSCFGVEMPMRMASHTWGSCLPQAGIIQGILPNRVRDKLSDQ